MENNLYNNNINNNNGNNNNSFLIKSIYGIIGGIQSILHIISGICDIFYLLKEFKTYILENIFKGIKLAINYLKYILTFEFINNKTARLISNLITSLGISLTLILLILIKKEKQNYINKQTNEEKSQLNLCFNSIE